MEPVCQLALPFGSIKASSLTPFPITGLDTVEDLINAIEGSGAEVDAAIDPTGRFFSVQSTESGSTLSIGENGSDLASRLGIRTFDSETTLSELNFGQGIFLSEQGPDLVFTRTDGTEMEIDLDGALNVQDVINRINNQATNFDPTTRIEASLTTDGNGIVLSAQAGAQAFSVRNGGGSEAAWALGLLPDGSTSSESVDDGAITTLQGRDVSGVEVEGVFTSLIRLQEAIELGRPQDITRIADSIEEDSQKGLPLRAAWWVRGSKTFPK